MNFSKNEFAAAEKTCESVQFSDEISEELKQKLQNLAQKYETADFCNEDPSRFLKWYRDFPKFNDARNTECAAFVAAMLAFGSRKQFIPKIEEILTLSCDAGIAQWCADGAKNFPKGQKKFYRFYSYDDLRVLFDELAFILSKEVSLGEYFRKLSNLTPNLPLHRIVSQAFEKSKIVPKGKNSANKRVNMFLRWMVRQNSPVDLGLWTWADQKNLIIPLDVHVMQESVKLGLLPPNASASLKTAEYLTRKLAQVFPDDPVKGDFALFGLGVENQ